MPSNHRHRSVASILTLAAAILLPNLAASGGCPVGVESDVTSSVRTTVFHSPARSGYTRIRRRTAPHDVHQTHDLMPSIDYRRAALPLYPSRS